MPALLRRLAPVTLAALVASFAVGCASSKTSREVPIPPRDETVTSADLDRTAGESIERVLMAKVPGLWVTRTADGGIALRIRGANPSSQAEPLYILDGMAIAPGPGGSLVGLNPYDIETIKVLKDPADVSMYGSRGAHGVIIITTKRP